MLFQQQSFCNAKPTLYLVATPIGNLEDITLRALATLKEVFLILAEDTRRAKKLLHTYQIQTPLLSYYEHNQTRRLHQILELLSQGKNIALISDAGTPLISDPGFSLVCEMQKHGFNVVAIPGVSAFLTAFMTSAIPSPFIFLAFLPRLSQALEKYLLQYKNASESLVIYESPHRIKKTLLLIHKLYGNRKISLARELTKKFETIINGNLDSILEFDLINKGEYVIVVAGNPNPNEHLLALSINDHVLFYLKLGFNEKEAFSKVAQERNITKKEIYHQYKIKNPQS
ncbi:MULTISPECIES: 16S rRNA (cytidine(1402)-2'-O)-methyltransferase [16SrI (Aster yellows group)]|uniref:Ribosomal RNA small subunit methyltransferase I n=1 Tax='Santalum album' aster yellows phytoplasma TaxID=2831467 RepID=A0ABS5LK55_9MOLU|nr:MULTISPECIES: 16S rRNA (cytidine(1402)-2'-O)-methyltransferase [16SrI (Aster yellows group)]MBS2993768.1 16S rRNA (cytidine(1402)-2'-O)-methyltransferase ['Santalum album' aster yellows phytoplasma]